MGTFARLAIAVMLLCTLHATQRANAAILLEITNPSFEDRDSLGDGLGGDFGWTFGPDGGTNRLGSVTVTTPDPAVTPTGGAHEGTCFMWGRGVDGSGSSHPSRLIQRLDLSPYSAEIDAGSASVHFRSFGLGDDLNEDLVGDFAQMHIAFFDSAVGGTQLGEVASNVGVAYAAWTELSIDSAVIAGTRSGDCDLHEPIHQSIFSTVTAATKLARLLV